jgi:YVTN family beta-propeller protein
MRIRFLLLLSAAAISLQAASTPANALLVLEQSQNEMLIVDPVKLEVVARVPVGKDPHEVSVSGDGKIAYVSNYSGGKTISVVDLVGQKTLPPIDLGALIAPHGLELIAGKLYFTAEGAKVVGRYDLAAKRIDWVMGTGQDRTHMVLVSKDLKTVFTSNVGSASVSILNRISDQTGGGPGVVGGSNQPDWSVTNVPVGKGAEGVDLLPNGKELWVANAEDGTISIVNVASKTVAQTIRSTKAANRLKFTPDGKYALVSDFEGQDLLVIDVASRKEYKRIPLGGKSAGVLILPDGTRAYASLYERNAVKAIDLKTMAVVGQVKTGQGPDGLAWAVRK